MSVDTRERFLRAAIVTAVRNGSNRSVRCVAAEALATPSLLYRYFGSIEELDAAARTVALATVLGDDVGHDYLVELLVTLPAGPDRSHTVTETIENHWIDGAFVLER